MKEQGNKTKVHTEFMNEAVKESTEGMMKNHGGPFGTVVVKDGKIIGRGHNCVTSTNDPTAHAEIVAIREACKNLDCFQLTDCDIYTSCEPCPMCLGAIYWARPRKVYFANTKTDAARIGFDDSFIYDEIRVSLDKRKIPFEQISSAEALEVFKNWTEKEDKIKY